MLIRSYFYWSYPLFMSVETIPVVLTVPDVRGWHKNNLIMSTKAVRRIMLLLSLEKVFEMLKYAAVRVNNI